MSWTWVSLAYPLAFTLRIPPCVRSFSAVWMLERGRGRSLKHAKRTAARVDQLTRSPHEAQRSARSEGPLRLRKLLAGRVLLLASPLHLPPTRHSPTTGSSSRLLSTRPSLVSAAICRCRGSSRTVPPVCHKRRTSTMYRHNRPTTACLPSQTYSQSLCTPQETTTALATHRIQTTSRPCHRPDSLPLTQYHHP